ncbi:MAG TPA: hypothetical protein PLH18_04120 [Clostridia bacterium]|nr:hypothetical protein [Clostridia bacterium]
MFRTNLLKTGYSSLGEIYSIRDAFIETDTNGNIDVSCKNFTENHKTVIMASLTNNGNSDIRIGRLYFIRDARLFTADDIPENSVVLLQRGECGRNRNMRICDLDEFDTSTIYTVIHNSGVGGLALGFITFDRMACKVEFYRTTKDTAASITVGDGPHDSGVRLSVYCDFNGYILHPGETIDSEKFYMEESGDSYHLLESFATAAGNHYKPKAFGKPPVGWIGSWNFRDGFYRENSEKLVKQNIKVIQERLRGFGVEYIWVSTVNTKDNLPGNWDLDNPYNFPSGLESLSVHCRENGMKLGLWFAPFWMNEASENLGYVKNAIAMKDGRPVITETGRVTHQPFNGKRPEELPRVYYLDPTHPDLHEFLERIFKYYNSIGISYYMVDFLLHGIDPDYDLHDKSVVNGPESFRMTMKVIRDAVSEGTYLLSSSGPTYYNIGLVDGVRASRDFGEGRPVQKYHWFYPAHYLVNDYDLIKEVTRDYAITGTNNKKLYINDAFNMITIQKPVPKNEARIVCSLFGLSGNPVMMGDDIPTICEERLAMLKKVLPVYDGNMLPCNLFEATYPDAPYVFRLDINKEYGDFSVLAVFNFNREPIAEKIDMKSMFGEGNRIVFDFWNEHVLGKVSEEITIHVPPRDVRVLRVTREMPHPWIIGSDMHLTQGGAEISHVHWDEEDLVLKGVCHRPQGQTGRLFIHIPDGYEPVDFRELFIVREESQDINPEGKKLLVGMKTLEFEVDTADFYIAFHKSF